VYGWRVPYASSVGPMLLDAVRSELPPPPLQILDFGCGNGWIAAQLTAAGYDVDGYDPDAGAIAIALRAYPDITFLRKLPKKTYDAVVSTEVVEHVYDAHAWASACRAAVRPSGLLICSTPYHGYLKNLALSLTGRWDRHFHPLRTGGHIKFWSFATLRVLLEQHGFTVRRAAGVGRMPLLWKSMLISATASGEVPTGTRRSAGLTS
jgi:2-polyprenyl-3-methyl-5-hydroxy-6-metoxy-1,4-benzoquinol methylase